ncbi:centrosomal protein of 164 kDa-like isoform X2 [Triplophysa dalaica]|uniref:centrosomal protein of 164 kDa-like isoform X2 n=1 Tax=Triplophysa dalaica TaxID=1582913 RepID=UPI0024DF4A51|nr:centrosomal protein of 164 kDa-like isoform X2 [Triplophysa dalaica]
MTTTGLHIGDQLVLEEDYDENYIPSEQEIHEYATEIGIDPEREPELLWLAREGRVALLPPEWKPCQDVTGEVYYFNFSTGQSTWDHPCDEHYRHLVSLERERAQQARTAPVAPALALGKKNKEKKKKEKRDKKKEKRKDQESVRAPVVSGALAPIRGLSEGSAAPLRGALGSLSGLKPLKTSLGGARVSRHEERSAEEDSEQERLRDSGGLLHNLHLDLDALGGGLLYEESEVSGTVPPEERTEPELQDLALSGDHSPEGSSGGRHLPSTPPGGSREYSSIASCPLTSEAAASSVREEDEEMSDRSEGVQEEVMEETCADEENARNNRDSDERESFSRPDQTRKRSDTRRDKTEDRLDDQGNLTENRSHTKRDQAENRSDTKRDQTGNRSYTPSYQTEDKLDHQTRDRSYDQTKDRSNNQRDHTEDIINNQIDQTENRSYTKRDQNEDKLDNQRNQTRDRSNDQTKYRSHNQRDHTEDNLDDQMENRSYNQGDHSENRSYTQKDQTRDRSYDQTKDRSYNQRNQNENRSKTWRDHTENRSDNQRDHTEDRSYNQNDQTEEKSELERDQIEEKQKRSDSEKDQAEKRKQAEALEDERERTIQSEKSVCSVEEECRERDEEEQSEERAESTSHLMSSQSRHERDGKHQTDREIELFHSPDTPARITNMKSDTRKFVPQWNPVCSEESEAIEPVKSLSFTDDVQGSFHTKFSENVFDLMELSPAEKSNEAERVLQVDSWKVSDDVIRLEDVTSAKILQSADISRPSTARGRSDISTHGDRDKSEQKKEERQAIRQTVLEEKRKSDEEERDRRMQEESRRLTDEKEKRLQLLRATLMKEEEEEELRMREESAEQLRLLKEQLLRKTRDEEEKLNTLRHTQLQRVRDESEVKLRDLRSELEVKRDKVETEMRRSLEHLRAESEEELRAERKRLLEKKDEQLTSIRLETKLSDRQKDLRSPRPEQPLAEYQRELTDVLQEVREEVERDHRRKLQQRKEEHQHELQNLRETHLEQESRERERLLHSLQEERETLISKHTTQLHKLQNMLDTQLEEIRRTHTQKESVLQELMKKLEIQTKELHTQETELQARESDVRKRRQQLCEEHDDIQRGVQSLPLLLKENQDLHDELQRARADVQKERAERERESCRVMEERERLEKRLLPLQERCEQLTSRVSELEQKNTVSRVKGEAVDEQKKMKKRENHLRLEDLEAPASSPSDSDTSVDGVRQYMWNESVSLFRARQFLNRQSDHVSDRQAALQAAHSSLKDPTTESSAIQHQLYHNLQQEVKDLSELRETLQKGQSLLKEKEEKLNLLETSLTEEVSCEDDERSADRKVTFDVTESETSSVYGHEGTVPVKVQQLADSLQVISGQLNSVLGALGSLNQKQNPPSLTTTQLPCSSWAWPINPSPSLHTHRPTDLLQTTWSARNTETSRVHMTYSGYTPASLSSLRPSAEVEGHRLQSLIEGNKRWLEAQRKNRNIPLFPNLRTPSSSSGFMQLSLDDNNQIKVHHY